VEISVQPNITPNANTFRTRNQISARNDRRRSQFGNSALNMTLYPTTFLPGRRRTSTTVIAMHRALRSDAMEKLEPGDSSSARVPWPRNVAIRSTR